MDGKEDGTYYSVWGVGLGDQQAYLFGTIENQMEKTIGHEMETELYGRG